MAYRTRGWLSILPVIPLRSGRVRPRNGLVTANNPRVYAYCYRCREEWRCVTPSRFSMYIYLLVIVFSALYKLVVSWLANWINRPSMLGSREHWPKSLLLDVCNQMWVRRRLLPSVVCGCPDCVYCHLKYRIGSIGCRTRSSHDRSRWRRHIVDRKQNLGNKPTCRLWISIQFFLSTEKYRSSRWCPRKSRWNANGFSCSHSDIRLRYLGIFKIILSKKIEWGFITICILRTRVILKRWLAAFSFSQRLGCLFQPISGVGTSPSGDGRGRWGNVGNRAGSVVGRGGSAKGRALYGRPKIEPIDVSVLII